MHPDANPKLQALTISITISTTLKAQLNPYPDPSPNLKPPAGVVDVYSLKGSLAEPTGRTRAQQISVLERMTATVQDGAAGHH